MWRHEPKRAHGLVHIVTAGSGYIQLMGSRGPGCWGGMSFFPRSSGHTLSSDSGGEKFRCQRADE